MFEFKLQIGCLLVIMYYVILYIRSTAGKNKMKCHPLFDWMLIVSPWAVIFDGATAYTVNHPDVVSPTVNTVLHALFFVTVNAMIILVFAYITELVLGNEYTLKRKLMFLPGTTMMIAIVMTMPCIHYIKGSTTNYSMGIPVYICFASLVVHFVCIGIALVLRRKMIEKRKKVNVFFYIAFSFAVLIVQIAFPESLLSSLLPVASLMFIYENFENANTRRLKKYNEEMVAGFATLVENRDDNTGGHIKRTKEYVSIMLKNMKKDPRYKDILTKDYTRNVVDAAPIHDIGKISTPDRILLKPGKLDDEEYAIMKQHAAIGGEIINETFSGIDDPEYLEIAYEVARHHHEKWNGKGYPDGLANTDIPLHARVMAIADVFDAVSAKRCYRDAMPLEKCFKIIEEGAGTDFDPALVELFMASREKIVEYYNANK